jgi:hypothetical protein
MAGRAQSVKSLATALTTGVRFPVGTLLADRLVGGGFHSASYPICSKGFFPRNKAAGT